MTFPWLADILVAVETILLNGFSSDSFTYWLITSLASSPIPVNTDPNTLNWNPAVECSDADQQFLGTNATAAITAKVEPLLQALYKQSYMGHAITGSHYIQCAGWQIRSKDVFKGNLP
jgi:hypothetical protein